MVRVVLTGIAVIFAVVGPGINVAEAEVVGHGVVVRARGTSGLEAVDLLINGLVHESVVLSTVLESYEFSVAGGIDEVAVRFVNDGHNPVDRNVFVDYVEIDGSRYETEVGTTFSTGTYGRGSGCAPGNKSSSWLHCNGYLEYAIDPVGPLLGETDSGSPLVIFDTDMGPDIDDALALALIHGYQETGQAELAAVTISRNSANAVRYVDAVNTFYGRPDIPIAKFSGTTTFDTNDRYTITIPASGNYPSEVNPAQGLEGYELMRKTLAGAADGQVVIVQTGFSHNTAELLRSGPDEFSPLTGLELVRSKVRLLSIMGGDNGTGKQELNFAEDPLEVGYVVENWPTSLLQSEHQLGFNITYPVSSIYQDFDYVSNHPIKDSYLNEDLEWHEDAGSSYNMRIWDLTSVIAAVEDPNDYFSVSSGGQIVVQTDGSSIFIAGGGQQTHKTLGTASELDSEAQQKIVNLLTDLVPLAPGQ